MIFLDTYALLRVMEDPDYLAEYSEDNAVTLTTNLAELHHVFHRKYSVQVADHFTQVYSSIKEPLTQSLIVDAMRWRYPHSATFSYADALGYQYALYEDIPFVTGDRDFEGMENVMLRR